MTTHQSVLRSLIHLILIDRFPDSVPLRDIYDFVDENTDWDEDDMRPPTIEGVPVSYPSWMRNIRSTLQNDLNSGSILRPERATYVWNGDEQVDYETQSMQFPIEVEIIQMQLDEERTTEDEEVVNEELSEAGTNQDTRGWIYVLWCPAYPDWVVTGKSDSARTRPQGYNTYTPHRDYEVVGMSYVDDRNQGERNLQREIDREYPNRRGTPSSRGPSEWFHISQDEAFEVLEQLNPYTYRVTE